MATKRIFTAWDIFASNSVDCTDCVDQQLISTLLYQQKKAVPGTDPKDWTKSNIRRSVFLSTQNIV